MLSAAHSACGATHCPVAPQLKHINPGSLDRSIDNSTFQYAHTECLHRLIGVIGAGSHGRLHTEGLSATFYHVFATGCLEQAEYHAPWALPFRAKTCRSLGELHGTAWYSAFGLHFDFIQIRAANWGAPAAVTGSVPPLLRCVCLPA